MIKEKYLFNTIMVLAFFIPTTIYYLFDTSSQAIGLAISIIILLPFVIKNLNFLIFTRNELIFLSISLTYIMFTMLFNSIYIHEYNVMKFFSGLVFVIVMIFSAKLLAIYIKDSEIRIDFFVKVVFIILITIAFLISLRNIFLDININAYHNKNLFIFREPSHFALLFTPLLIYHFMSAQVKGKIIYFFIGLFFTIFIKSLLLMVGLIFMVSVLLYQQKAFLVGLFLVIFLLFASDSIFLPDYFLDRMLLTTNSDNLSVLVYLNGWERMHLNLNLSNFFGIGFQQLGFIGDQGILMERIEEISNKKLNLFDGSFLASKLISELGMLGILLVSVYLLYMHKALNYLTIRKPKDKKIILAYSFIISFFLELFFRGIGYFSFSLFMVLTSFFYIQNETNQ